MRNMVLRLLLLGLMAFSLTTSLAKAELLEVGEKAPSFFIRDLAGKKWQLHVYRYKVKGKEFVQPIFVLDFFATWCKPCKKMMPYMAKLSQQYKDRDVVFLLIDFTEKREVFANWVKANKISIPACHDTGGKLLAKRFNVESMPTLYVIDRDKQIALSMSGGGEDAAACKKKANKIKRVIDELLAKDEADGEEE